MLGDLLRDENYRLLGFTKHMQPTMRVDESFLHRWMLTTILVSKRGMTVCKLKTS
ncbi:unnamed protein product [Acanthoscelides obtectus]|uniref:Uncharacterized protein n=1 Tax=Acanthoscelides obtectus TaxID=200917 RepID=A0A9P0L2G0_ACAOB|nr:unnamed protein product [Acanthoscelides obtectus]CAK1640503.1 hypothetical protein AOBTE_LOCUS11765 [Acanthoscelides obtectus]